MNLISNNLKIMTHKITLGALVLILMTAFSGCFANYGRLRLSKEVDDTFKDAIVMPGHKYYYFGSDVKPFAILAIQNSYTLRTGLWKEVDLDSEQLRKWILFMNEQLPEYSIRTYGSRVVDPEGKQIGIWYSAWNMTSVKMLGGNEVAVYPPFTGNSAFNSYLEPEWRNK